MKKLALIAAPGTSLPAPLPVLCDLLSQSILRSFGAGAATVRAAHITSYDDLSRALHDDERAILVTDRSIPVWTGRSEVLWAALSGPERPAIPLSHRHGARVALDLDPKLRPHTALTPRLEALLPQTRESFGRLARLALGLRVGVALGAGGAWGFAHVPVLTALLDAGIPIDAVAGSSFGTVVAAYFCARGRRGLAQMVEEHKALGRAAQRSFFSMDSLERHLDRSLSGARMEDLLTSLLPLTVNLDKGDFHIATEGEISAALRQSGSFPGLFGPTVTGSGRMVDGCIRSSVPDSVFGDGFGLVIASNVVPPPKQRAPKAPPKSRTGAWLSALNPVSRAQDLIRSAHYWLHAAGEVGPAHVRFRLEEAPAPLWDFDQAEEVMRLSEGPAQKTAEEALRKWDALKRSASVKIARSPLSAGQAASLRS